jgi:hypothetical protein
VFTFNTLNCSYSASANFEYLAPDHPDCTLGTAERTKRNGLLLFPNPTNENIYLELDKGVNSNRFITLYSVDGKRILEKNLGKAEELLELDVRELDAGMYIIVLSSDTQSTSGIFQKL